MKKKFRVVLILMGIVASIQLIGFVFSSELAKNRRKFDSLEWKNWIESESEFRLRWEMIGSLERNHQLKHQTKGQIISLLGSPDNGSKNRFSYNLGLTGSGINAGVLEIIFNEDGICIKSKVREH